MNEDGKVDVAGEKSPTFLSDHPGSLGNISSQYPPKDRGAKAWLFLIGASIVEVTAWGMEIFHGYDSAT